MPFVEFKKLWKDDDEMLEVACIASNSRYTASVEFYAYPDDFVNFANAMEAYPKSGNDQIIFECGEDKPDSVIYIKVNIGLRDKAGHSFIKFDMLTNGDESAYARNSFSLLCNPSDINAIAKKMMDWINSDKDVFRYEWQE